MSLAKDNLAVVLEPGISKLNGSNYPTWKFSIQATLQARDLWKYCLVKDSKEESKIKNAEAKALIWNSMDDIQKGRVGNCETAHDLWLKIQDIYEGTQSDLTARALCSFLGIRYMKGEKMLDYCSRYEALLGKLLATGYKIDEKSKIWAFKNSLPNDLYNKVDLWEMVKVDATANELVTMMRTRDRREHQEDEDNVALYVTNQKQGHSKSNTRNATTNVQKPANRSSEQTRNAQPKTGAKCNYCKKTGHFWRDCRKLKEDNKRKKKFANAKSSQKNENAYMAVDSDGSRTYGKSMNRAFAKDDLWIVDSGATKHMTHNKSNFSNYQRLETPLKVTLGDGDATYAYAIGEVLFETNGEIGKLSNVLWVPKIKQNLFSVKQSLLHGFDVLFSTKHSKVNIVKDAQVKLSGHQIQQGLLAVKIKPVGGPQKQHRTETAYVGVPVEEWHQRFAHANINSIKELVKKNAVLGLKIDQVSKADCLNCLEGKICRTPHHSRQMVRGSKDALILHFDTVGPVQTESLGGSRYFVLATDEYSGFKMIKFTSSKGQITSEVRKLINYAELHSGKTVKMILTDNGTEYVSRYLNTFLARKGTIHEVSTPYTPEQNGLAERANRTVIEGVRTVLAQSGLPHTLWCEAANMVVYAHNRLLSTRDKNRTRYELFYGKKPDVSNLKVFGQQVFCKIPKPKRGGKWSPIGKVYRLVGYSDRFNTYRLYDPDRNRVFTACDVKFISPRTETARKISPVEQEDEQSPLITIRRQKTNKQVSFAPDVSSTSTELYDHEYETLEGTADTLQEADQNLSINDQIHNEIKDKTGSKSPRTKKTQAPVRTLRPLFVRMNRVSDNDRNQFPSALKSEQEADDDDDTEIYEDATSADKPSPERGEVVGADGLYDTALFTLDDEPRTRKDAMESEDWPKWKQAMDEELAALRKNNTWILVDRPQGKRLIKNKWVYKIKLNPDGTVAVYKARLCAKGYTQIPNVDYKETFAPVASMTTVRIFLSVSNQLNMEVIQFDVKTAFLHGDLDEELYMEYPDGYPNPDNKVCKLVKSLYGLKQAPRQWNLKFDRFLKHFDLKQSSIDKCLYYNNEKSIFLVLYVDDGLVAAHDKKLLDDLVAYLKNNLELKTMECESFLGFQVKRNRREQTTSLTQTHYVEKILERFKMSDCKPVSTPEEVGVFNSEGSPLLGPEYPYKEAIGSLLYLVTCTRPDIAHAVSIASRTDKPTMAHWQLIKRILRYLAGTKGYGIVYKRVKLPELIAYSDADYANDPETRRSVSGYCILFGNSPIAWRCQRQPIVSLSTTEAEYISGCELVKDLLPIREMCLELKQIEETPTKLYVDNQSTVNIAKDIVGHQRTKHIDVRHRWLTRKRSVSVTPD